MKNRKGFAISVIMYSILLLFIVLLASIMAILATRKTLLDKSKQDVTSFLNVAESNISAVSSVNYVLYGENHPLPGSFFNTDSSNVECVIDSAIYTNTNALDDGIYDVTCTIVYEDLKYESASTEIHIVRNQYDFEYTGNYQEFKVYRTGYYQLETWGAEGGTANGYAGGKGGYAKGVKYLKEGETVYVYVGGRGTTCHKSTVSACTGGFNGGGTAGYYTGDAMYSGSGGGATHMATAEGILSSLSDNKNSVLLVAAGGGGGMQYSGATNSGIGGAGGGLTGSKGTNGSYVGTNGATQNSGSPNNHGHGTVGSFGQGGSAVEPTNYISGGGGGWYGAGAAIYSGSGGGSSYIGGVTSTATISKTTISGDETMPSYVSGTMVGNSNDGYAQIKFIGIEADTGNYEEKAEFTYTGDYQEFVVPETGYYKVEAWGAQGNSSATYGIANAGKGGYTSGSVKLNAGEKLYIYVGSGGIVSDQGGYNGGGHSGTYTTAGSGGGGATDIRYFGSTTPNEQDLAWNSTLGLRSRVMVAAGGGGAGAMTANTSKPEAGGLTGFRSFETSYILNAGYPGTQTSGGQIPANYSAKEGLTPGSFGIGGNGNRSTTTGWGSGGGGGYYGGSGGSGAGSGFWPGAGGSSYISGYEGSVAITSATNQSPKAGCANGTTNEACSYHYSGLKFGATTMLAGNDIMPNPLGGDNITGNTGNGYVVITRYNPDEVDFEFKGYIQAYTAEKTGYYQLETWGAEGGTGNNYAGGKGGYATGVKYLEEGETVYIHVGGKGASECITSYTNKCYGGYNGGGNAGAHTGNTVWTAGGGGATHIASSKGILPTLTDDRDSVMLVAAGGGGGTFHGSVTYSGVGGAGGGLTGKLGVYGHATYAYTYGATQVSGGVANHNGYGYDGSFGKGGDAKSGTSYSSGGGGGWYGGASTVYAGASGGSSYIGGVISTTVLQKSILSGDQDIPTYDGSGIMPGNAGNGHAKITFMSDVATRTYNEDKYFAHMAREETFTAPITGYYELEAWGAQGGAANGYVGGKGGYSKGVIYLQQGEEIKVNVGGKGGSECMTSYTNKCYGGYNGGGNAGAHTGNTVWTGGGGGATHFATSTGLLTSFDLNRDNLLLVAGGGGAATMHSGTSYSANGGAGGGLVGGASKLGTSNGYGGCTPGSQTSGGLTNNNDYGYHATFGKGGDAKTGTTYATGGGGGFYGGAACLHASAPGGSSYIDGVESTSTITRETLDGDQAVPSYDGNGTMVGNINNGAAKVTYIGAVETIVESDMSHRENTEYTYYPGYQVYFVPYTGYYKLESWGAQGGFYNATYRGGYGAYTLGYYYAEKGDYIYIYTGGQGTTSSSAGTAVSGGFNGGGSAYGTGAGGGGATHIATGLGTLSELSTNPNSIILVAGGGGGAVYYSSASAAGNGGDAGGDTGQPGTTGGWATRTGQPGTQFEGGTFGLSSTTQCGYAGTFGQGGSGNPSSSNCPNNYIGGGGAGYYGGGSARHAGGGGGSGYLNLNQLVAGSKMFCYNCDSVDNLTSLTFETTNVSATPISEYAKTGNGSAKVTWLGIGNMLMIDAADGSYENSSRKEYMLVPGETLNLTIPVREDYTFMGWDITGTGTTINGNLLTMGSTNSTITAIWKLNDVLDITYTGDYKEIEIDASGYYKVELWGAGSNNNHNAYTQANPSYGGYVSGISYLEEGTKFYVYVGGVKTAFNAATNITGEAGSGGATDIRLVKGIWNDVDSLRSRIMVAGGAGGSYHDNSAAGGSSAGGLTNYPVSHASHPVYLATQTQGGAAGKTGTAGGFGYGGTNTNAVYNNGAGGYFGGGSGPAGGGGTSFISGHTGCVAVSEEGLTPRTGTGGAACVTETNDNLCSIHYSNLYFTSTQMIDGKGYYWTNTKQGLLPMPTPENTTYSSGGHVGNGHAKITKLGNYLVTIDKDSGSSPQSTTNYLSSNTIELIEPTKPGYRFLRWDVTGGTLEGNTFTVTDVNASVEAVWQLTDVVKYRTRTLTTLSKTYTDLVDWNNWTIVGNCSKQLDESPSNPSYQGWIIHLPQPSVGYINTGRIFQNIPIIAGHKYYIHVGGQAVWSGTMDILLPNGDFNGNAIAIDTIWTASSTTTSMVRFWNNETVDNHAIARYADIVDLTAVTGGGSEPDLAWCQANLGWFNGSKTISTPNQYSEWSNWTTTPCTGNSSVCQSMTCSGMSGEGECLAS